MKFKRFSAAITALAIATAASLSLTIVTADTRDRVAGFDNAKLNDYDLLDYEELTDDTDPDGETDPDLEGEGGEEGETDTDGETDNEGDTDGEGDTDPDSEDNGGEDGKPERVVLDGFSFEVLDDGTLSLIGYDGEEENLLIPDRAEGMAVTAIAAGALAGCQVVSVGIPEGVTYIGEGAFADCSALLWAYIPETVEYIGEGAFVRLPDEDIEYSGDNEDNEAVEDGEQAYRLTVFGYSASIAESYAYDNGADFFPLGTKLTDDLGFEVILQDGDGSEGLILNVSDGRHSNTDIASYFYIGFRNGAAPENPVIVKVPAPFGWDDISVWTVDDEGGHEISAVRSGDFVIFVTDEFDSEFMIVMEEPDDNEDNGDNEEDEGGEVTTPADTEPSVTTTDEPEVTTTPNTTTAPAENTTTEEVTTTTTEEATTTTAEETTATAEETTTTTAETTPVTADQPEVTTPATVEEPADTTTPPVTEAAPAETDDPAPTTTPPPSGDSADEDGESGDEDGRNDGEDGENEDEDGKATGDTAGSVLNSDAVLASPVIEVSVPSSISVIINPYGINVNIEGVDYGSSGVASPVYNIINRSTEHGIRVDGTASLTVPSIQYTSSQGKTVSKPLIQVLDCPEMVARQSVKSLCAYVLVCEASEQIDGDTPEDKLPDLFAMRNPAFDGDALIFADMTDSDITGSTANTSTLATLDKAEEGAFTYAQFRISGEITDNDVEEWTDDDNVNFTLVLNITPIGGDDDATADDDITNDDDDITPADDDDIAPDDDDDIAPADDDDDIAPADDDNDIAPSGDDDDTAPDDNDITPDDYATE